MSSKWSRSLRVRGRNCCHQWPGYSCGSFDVGNLFWSRAAMRSPAAFMSLPSLRPRVLKLGLAFCGSHPRYRWCIRSPWYWLRRGWDRARPPPGLWTKGWAREGGSLTKAALPWCFPSCAGSGWARGCVGHSPFFRAGHCRWLLHLLPGSRRGGQKQHLIFGLHRWGFKQPIWKNGATGGHHGSDAFQTGVQGLVGGKFVFAILSLPETPATKPHVPVGQVGIDGSSMSLAAVVGS